MYIEVQLGEQASQTLGTGSNPVYTRSKKNRYRFCDIISSNLLVVQDPQPVQQAPPAKGTREIQALRGLRKGGRTMSSAIRFSEQADQQIELMPFQMKMELLQRLLEFRDEIGEQVDLRGNIYIHFIEVGDTGEVKVMSTQENDEIPKETS